MKKIVLLLSFIIIFIASCSGDKSTTVQEENINANDTINSSINDSISDTTVYSRDSLLDTNLLDTNYSKDTVNKDTTLNKESNDSTHTVIGDHSDSTARDTVIVQDSTITNDTLPIDTTTTSDSSSSKDSTIIDKPIAFEFDTVSVTTIEKGTFNGITLQKVTDSSATSMYGGWLEQNVGGTGYFSLKEINGAWYFVDPLGYIFYSTGVTSVEQGGGIALPDDLLKNGINAMGNWSDESISGIPFSPRYSFLSSFASSSDERKSLYSKDIFPVFDTGFADFVDEKAAALADKYKDNPWVIGYYTDNELRFHHILLDDYFTLDSTNDNYIAAKKWLESVGGTISTISDEQREDFQAYVSETYMKTVNRALKKYDPNHLNLGCRIHASVKFNEKLVAAIGHNVDVNSINFYNRWAPTTENMDMWIDVGGAPFLISEFYTKAEDSGLSNGDGAGWAVSTQQDRAIHFQNMAITLMSHRGSVGWTWFRYIDKNDSNKGIVDLNYNWYTTLINAMHNIGKARYDLRAYLLERE